MASAYYFIAPPTSPVEIVKHHMKYVVEAGDAENATTFLQLIEFINPAKTNVTLAMAVFSSYEYFPITAEFFNHGHVYTRVDMKKPEREMYMYFMLRPTTSSPSGWTIYNVT
ncbi:hypothetical protein CRE_25631 [Caenorhabditis remanei]|uniref:Uncharacterized protein n=2 Tax=Caenorhabditis remanei TaxID=31234 RepID=E3ML40_CAERE|nr:hypothetical protein CRE_25631 [Caenorhabditis remanei]